jgi:hypothetical protein
MPEYRRNRIEGGTYFFTLALADRRSEGERGSGSGDFENIRYVMRLISGGTSIMSISTRSSMGWLAMLGIGRFHRFGGRWRGGIIQPIGEARVR